MEDCIFCKIVTGEVPSDIVYQNEELIAFPDINPLAPVHLLVISRKHVASLTDLSEGESSLIGDMAGVANQLAQKEGIAEKGYRLVVNCGRQGGQGVAHIHMHLLGGRQLSSTLG
ncbi:histidine triad nucleotide-binding protein [Chloroflexota bacterium]